MEGLFKQCQAGAAPSCRPGRPCQHGYTLERRWLGARIKIGINKHLKLAGDPRRPSTDAAAIPIATDIWAEVTRTGRYTPPAPAAARHPQTGASEVHTGDGERITFDELVGRFAKDLESGEDCETWKEERGRLLAVAAVEVSGLGPIGRLSLDRITSAIVEAAYKSTRGLANGTRNKYRRALRRVFRYAVAQQLLEKSPIVDGPDGTMMGKLEDHRRKIRVPVALERELLQAASEGYRPYEAQRLVDLIVAAVETGARLGELLALRWADVYAEATPRYVAITAIEQGGRKTGKARKVPLSARLSTTLQARRIGPDGRPYGPSKYVFGDVLGERISSVLKAWTTAVLRAHRIDVKWIVRVSAKGKKSPDYAPETRADLAALNAGEGLEFRDLRREAALRWHEAGMPLAHIAELLGHADLAMLRVYLGIDAADALDAHARLVEGISETPEPTFVVRAKPTNRRTATKPPLTRGSLRIVGGSETRAS